MKNISLLLCLILPLLASAQNDYESGYIKTINGDTIQGSIRKTIEEDFAKRVDFKDANGSSKIYTPGDIQGFGFSNGQIYRLISYTDLLENNLVQNHFAKLLVDGSFDLFTFMRKDHRFYVVRTQNDSTYFLFDDQKTTNGELIERGNYMNQIHFIGYSCEKLRPQAERTAYNERALVNYFMELEQCTGSSAAAKSFYQKSKVQTKYMVYAGGMVISNRYALRGQFSMRFILPSESRKTSLNASLNYYRDFGKSTVQYLTSDYEYDDVVSIVGVPLTIQYNILNGRIQPLIYAGLSANAISETTYTVSTGGFETQTTNRFGFSFVVGAGIEANLTNKLLIKVDWRYDLLVNLPVVGLAYQF